MDIFTLGGLVKKERKASGLSQESLAIAAGISRVTLANLEAGKGGDIGALKLFSVAENIGLPLLNTGRKMNFIKMTAGNINTSYKQVLSISELEKLMLTGKVKPGFEGQAFHLIEETPTQLVVGAVKQLAQKKQVPTKNIWKNLSTMARDIQSTNPFWQSIST